MIKYKNYSLEKYDDRNWKVYKEVKVKAKRDIINPQTQEVIHKKGKFYKTSVFIGFYSDVGAAMTGVVRDLAGKDCETLKDVVQQINDLKKDILGAVKAQSK